MPLPAILLLLGSALLHTTWNLILKKTKERNIVTWWAVLVGAGMFLPVLFFTGFPQGSVWILLLISVLIEIAYYLILAAAYNIADFSLIYPLARGAAPALIAIWSVLFLKEELNLAGMLSLATIILGLLVIGVSGLVPLNRTLVTHSLNTRRKGILLAGVTALLISAYSIVDATAVRKTDVFPYTIMIFLMAPVLTSPFVAWHYHGRRFWQPWRDQSVRILSIGFLTILAYLLALAAYSIAPLGYSGAVREVSVVLGALTGWFFLGEKMGLWRLAGAIIVFSGILGIAFFG